MKIQKYKLFLITVIVFFFAIGFNYHQPVNVKADSDGKDIIQPKYIIIFIGDGMGAEHRKAATYVTAGLDGVLIMDQLPEHGWSQTFSADNAITDSAAGGTAIATGHKTNNGVISLSSDGDILKTVLEYAQDYGLATGLVTTVQASHATPASFAAHVDSRYLMNEIALQLSEKNVNVMFGGGEDEFLPASEIGCYPESGERMDNRNLITEMIDNGYSYVCSGSQLNDLNLTEIDHLVGLFADEEMVRPFSPSLAKLTESAIEVLSHDPDGFFLMIEGGQIDWASHNNDAANAIQDTIDFNEAVQIGYDFIKTKENGTLIVVADHETGGMSIHFDSDVTDESEDGPFFTKEGIPFYIRWTTTGHTASNVPISSFGSGSHLLNTTVDNTQIFWALSWQLFSHNYIPMILK